MDEMKFKIVSGGQTGIDQAALAAAVAAEVPYGGNLRLGHTLASQSPNEPSSPLLAPTAPTSRRCAPTFGSSHS